MASMWRWAMVYLGLQDDEPDYNGEYEAYAGYGDAGESARDGGYDEYGDPGDPRREVGSEADADTSVRTAPPPQRPGVQAVERRPGPVARGGEMTQPTNPRPSVVRTIGPTTAARVHVVEPQGFNDAQEVGDRLKANQPVILNLQGLPKELQRRLIDFSSGLAYAVGGHMERTTQQVFLLKPSDVEVSQEEKERLQARGLYQA